VSYLQLMTLKIYITRFFYISHWITLAKYQEKREKLVTCFDERVTATT